ncbi:hypothetical protein [Agarilytica rhodophyticola]|uniref:hypothetical protein n=1 Tax=Agarilytica rhodophyticola TaxID=1737490 RepID=UPI00131A3525|nr:hypothetical protein [Agarilytica rhodophyticola]
MGGCFSVPRVNQTGNIQTFSRESSSSSRCRPEAPVMSNPETNSLLVDSTCQPESRSEIVSAWESWAQRGSRTENRTEALKRLKNCLEKNSNALSLSNLSLQDLPDKLPPNLTVLNVQNNQLSTLPKAFSSLDRNFCIYAENNAFPYEVRNAIYTEINRPDYEGPVILHSTMTATDNLHAAFGVAGVNIITQEDWRNNSWGESVFIQLPVGRSKPKSIDCVDQAIFVNALEEGADIFCNAVDGNAQGMGAKVGTDRYFKVSTSMGNFFVSLNKNANTEQEIRELKNNCSLRNKSATFLSLQHDKDVPIARISYNNDGRPYIRLGMSELHGQDTYKVYSIKSQQQLSLDQAIQRVNVGNTSFPTRQPDGVMLKQSLLARGYTPDQLTQVAKGFGGRAKALQTLAEPAGRSLLVRGYTRDQLTQVAKGFGGAEALQTLAGPAGQSLLARDYTPDQLTQVAMRDNGSKALQTLAEPTVQRLLVRDYTREQLTRVAKGNGSKALQTLAESTGQSLLDRGYTPDLLTPIAEFYDGVKTLQNLAGPVSQSLQDRGYTQTQLTQIAKQRDGLQFLQTLVGPTGQRLLSIGYTPDQLTQIAERYNVSLETFQTLAGSTGQSLQGRGYTPDQLTQVAKYNAQALQTLAGPTGQRLLGRGYTPDQLTQIAEHSDVSQKTLQTLAGPAGQRLLVRDYTRDQLTQIAKGFSGAKTLQNLAGPTGQRLLGRGYTPDQLTQIAEHCHLSQETLQTLAGPAGQRLLGRGYTLDQLTQIAISFGREKAFHTLAGSTGQSLLDKGYTSDQLTQIAKGYGGVKTLQTLAGPNGQRGGGN